MKKCLIVVDYQQDFVTGSLGFAGAEALDGRIAARIADYRAEGGDVLFTMDTHRTDYLAKQEGRKLPVPHCIEGTSGHALYGAVGKAKKDGDRAFCKGTFGSDELYAFLRENPYGQIEFAGVVSNICVISNVVLAKTAQPETGIVVDAALTASNDKNLHEAALKVMESLQVTVKR